MMKKMLLSFAFAALGALMLFAAPSDAAKRRAYAKSVYGRIQFVDGLPDFRVRVVSGLEDLRVQIVSGLANSPGKWQIVDSMPDYRIQIVSGLEDFTIRYVNGLPGPSK